MSFASRAGEKLEFALSEFNIDPGGLICADLGCSTGGFTDCLLQHGAHKIYSVDTGYGVLDWKLRLNPNVVVMERTNALHVTLPEPVDLITIDVGWTPQRLIIPHAVKLLKQNGKIISLLKPHYEIKKPKLRPEEAEQVLRSCLAELKKLNLSVLNYTTSPIQGEKAGNIEYLLYIKHLHD